MVSHRKYILAFQCNTLYYNNENKIIICLKLKKIGSRSLIKKTECELLIFDNFILRKYLS